MLQDPDLFGSPAIFGGQFSLPLRQSQTQINGVQVISPHVLQQHGQPVVDVSWLLTRENCTMYVGLLCEFEPSTVWPFLQAHDHLVDVEQCKQWCRKHGLLEAAAHLLEREGDISGALDIHLTKVER